MTTKKNKLYNREEQQKKDRVVGSPLHSELRSDYMSIEEIEEFKSKMRESWINILRQYEKE